LRIRMHQAAQHGSPGPDRTESDLGGMSPQQCQDGRLISGGRQALHVAMRHQRIDRQSIVQRARAQGIDAADIDQHMRRQHAVAQHGQQALPARQHPAIATQASQLAQHLFHAARTTQFQRRYLHAGSPAARIFSSRSSGLIGTLSTWTPRPYSAFLTALAMVAAGASAPPSPMPFMPNSENGDGVFIWMISMRGTSSVLGMV